MQQSKLQNLIKFVELDEFLHLMKNDSFLDRSLTLDTLKKWQKRFPSSTDPVHVWDDMCCNRQLYLKKLQSRIEKKIGNPERGARVQSSQNSLELCDAVDEESHHFKTLAVAASALTKINFAEKAAEQKNFPVALKRLKEVSKVSKSLDQDVWSKFIQCYCSVNNKRCHFMPENKLDILLQSVKQLTKLENKCGIFVDAKKLLSQSLELIGKMFLEEEVFLSSLSSENKDSIVELSGSSDQIAPALLEKSFLCLKEVVSLEKSNEDSPQKFALAHMSLANFCNQYLRKEEDEEPVPKCIPSLGEFPVVLTESLLTALEGGVGEAIQLFPRLLQIIELYPESLQIFKEKVSTMPCWLFIDWMDQLLILMDKPQAAAVQGVIEKITLAYPEAIIYAFHLSYGKYQFPDTDEGKINKAFVEKIHGHLGKHTLISEFAAAIEQLSVPAVMFKDYVEDIAQLVCTKASKQQIISAFQTLCDNMFNLKVRGPKRLAIGPMQQKFAKDYKDKVLEACGEKGQKLISAKYQEQMAALKGLSTLRSASMAAAKKRDPKITQLEDLSSWLSRFQSWTYPTHIEIPGQYTGKSKPLPEYHVKISGFDEKVMVLSSLTLPRRITICGNDEKEYKILVKAGEDLRQDARIQQMFSLMNEIYQNNIACAKRHIQLKTYKVIPLSNRLGIIEWLDNTAVLQSFMADGMTRQDQLNFMTENGSNAARDKFLQWVKAFGDFTSLYSQLYKEKSREECVNKFREIVETVPKYLLVKSFLKLSSSPEAFVALRTRFSTSHAVVCLSQWILGIGDRHLGNFLVDKRSGSEIGIDFGHAFGSATQFLGVPELVPFRLTPQYLQLLDPLKEKGIYEVTMVHALSALQDKRELLLNMMDIFIKEPTLDWKVLARKQQLEWGDETITGDDWFPKQRIALARRKLNGVNPSCIMRDELELGHHSKECFQGMESVCLGSKEHNTRAKYGMTGLTPEEQVDCLIDQATDPHLLCLTYCGWNAWM